MLYFVIDAYREILFESLFREFAEEFALAMFNQCKEEFFVVDENEYLALC